MPQTQGWANVTHTLNSNAWNLAAKIQQGRTLHMQELGNLYMEGCVTNAPSEYLSLLETTMAARGYENKAKTANDVSHLSEHEFKVTQALQGNPHVLSGGAITDTTLNARRALKYSTRRSSAMVENLGLI